MLTPASTPTTAAACRWERRAAIGMAAAGTAPSVADEAGRDVDHVTAKAGTANVSPRTAAGQLQATGRATFTSVMSRTLAVGHAQRSATIRPPSRNFSNDPCGSVLPFAWMTSREYCAR